MLQALRPILCAVAGVVAGATAAAAGTATATVTLDMTPGAAISPQLFGANYEWNLVPVADFADWTGAMPAMADAPTRYPSGWNAENYVWGQNQEVAWDVSARNCYTPTPNQSCANHVRGAGPHKVLSAASMPSFVVPSKLYVKDPTQDNLQTLEAQSTALVQKYGARVGIWEIGNEWWLQGPSDSASRAQRLTNYAALVAAVAPRMKAADSSIQIFAGVDWQNPQEVATLRADVGATAWQSIDGLSIHAYCSGDTSLDDMRQPCADLSSVAAQIRSASGKELLYDSEWNGSEPSDKYIVNAYMTVFAIEAMVDAGIQAATYWPTAYIDFQESLINSSYDMTPTGILLSWLAQHYKGHALATSGRLPAIAALANGGNVTVFVPTQDTGPIEIKIPLKGTGLSRIYSAKVLYTSKPGASKAETADLPGTIKTGGKGKYADFVLNPGTAKRGTSWEIARITLAP